MIPIHVWRCIFKMSQQRRISHVHIKDNRGKKIKIRQFFYVCFTVFLPSEKLKKVTAFALLQVQTKKTHSTNRKVEQTCFLHITNLLQWLVLSNTDQVSDNVECHKVLDMSRSGSQKEYIEHRL